MITLRQAIAQFQVAMMLLTRLPAGNLSAPIPKLRDAVWAFPLVGLVVGAGGAVVLSLALWVGLPADLAAGLAVATGVLATGGLHEDGLADLADGFGGGQTRARKLEIMRDSQIGSYGTLALIFSVGVRWHALALVVAISPGFAACASVAIAVISRAGLPAMMVVLPPARDDGLGKSASGGGWAGAAGAAAIGLVATAILLGPVTAGAVAGATALALAGVCVLALHQIGGQTGDVLGAGQQLAEGMTWVVLVALVTS